MKNGVDTHKNDIKLLVYKIPVEIFDSMRRHMSIFFTDWNCDDHTPTLDIVDEFRSLQPRDLIYRQSYDYVVL